MNQKINELFFDKLRLLGIKVISENDSVPINNYAVSKLGVECAVQCVKIF